MGLSIITFQRRLTAHKMVFKQELEHLRKRKAADYLKEGMPIQQAADRLWYNEQSNFQRAFKRWYAQPPKQFLASDH